MAASAVTAKGAEAAARRRAAADHCISDVSSARPAIHIVVSASNSTARGLAKGIRLQSSQFVHTVAVLATTSNGKGSRSCKYRQLDFTRFPHRFSRDEPSIFKPASSNNTPSELFMASGFTSALIPSIPISLEIRIKIGLYFEHPPAPPAQWRKQCFSPSPSEFDLSAEHCLGYSPSV